MTVPFGIRMAARPKRMQREGAGCGRSQLTDMVPQGPHRDRVFCAVLRSVQTSFGGAIGVASTLAIVTVFESNKFARRRAARVP